MNDEKKKKEKPVEDTENNVISVEEQLMRRQSAPRPTAQDEANRILQQIQAEMIKRQGDESGTTAIKVVIGKDQVNKFNSTLDKYKQGKKNLEEKIIDNEQWYKLRHWESMRKSETQEIEPSSAWLVNCILNKHADAMDNFPLPNILPREEGDKAEAEMLSSIIPVILEHNDFEETYSDVSNYKLKTGAGCYGVFWDSSKLNGLGDISIQKIDLLNLFWEPGITDIQKSRYVYHVEIQDNEFLENKYPQTRGRLGSETGKIAKYHHDDTIDTTNKSEVVDVYYKKLVNGKTILHYCKYVNDIVLFATENEEKYTKRGLYDHGLYPFVIDTLFKLEGTIAGFGYIDLGKDSQTYIDRGNQAIMMNFHANARPRHFIRKDGSINEAEYLDQNNPLVHVDGNLGQDSLLPIQANPLNSVYVQILNNKIDELKETTGNRDISSGGTTSGVTAASAIAAMQEAGSKLSRNNNKASYRAFRKVINLVIELIRQFYELPRCFRIMGSNGTERYVSYTNAGIQPQTQGNVMGVDMGYRLPAFDIEVTAQKQSPYSKMSQNELALQFYNAGFFNPQMSDQALACLDMMDFDRKHFIMQKIAQNGTMFQQIQMMQAQMLQMAQIIDQQNGTNMTQQLTQGFGMTETTATTGEASTNIENTEALGGKEGDAEASVTKKARQRVAESTDPS